MIVLKNSVLLLKTQNEDEPDKYERILEQNGFNVKYLQLLDFQYVNLDILREKLQKPDDYSGIIFTSPRGVHATKSSLNELNLWENKCNYVVGESTFDLAKNELNLICEGKETGNANNLAELIISNVNNSDNKYLFPCGNLKKETLAKRLNEHNILLDAVTVYETIENKTTLTDFKQITNNLTNISEYIVFFSPSGVDIFNNLIRDLKLPFDDLKLIAIGPSTEEKLKNENLPVFSVAKKPTETELLNAILNIK